MKTKHSIETAEDLVQVRDYFNRHFVSGHIILVAERLHRADSAAAGLGTLEYS